MSTPPAPTPPKHKPWTWTAFWLFQVIWLAVMITLVFLGLVSIGLLYPVTLAWAIHIQWRNTKTWREWQWWTGLEDPTTWKPRPPELPVYNGPWTNQPQRPQDYTWNGNS